MWQGRVLRCSSRSVSPDIWGETSSIISNLQPGICTNRRCCITDRPSIFSHIIGTFTFLSDGARDFILTLEFLEVSAYRSSCTRAACCLLVAQSCSRTVTTTCPTQPHIPDILSFFVRQRHFEAWKLYAKKCVNLRQILSCKKKHETILKIICYLGECVRHLGWRTWCWVGVLGIGMVYFIYYVNKPVQNLGNCIEILWMNTQSNPFRITWGKLYANLKKVRQRRWWRW